MHVVIKASPLHNVCGRVDYISNPKRQEHLLAVKGCTDTSFWKSLADCCQKQGKYAKQGKVCEGREFVIPVPHDIYNKFENEELCQELLNVFEKSNPNKKAICALHMNKSMKNPHVHIVFSEREVVEPKISLATRNTYFRADGKRVSKSECIDDKGNLLKGCRFVPKGENLNEKGFGSKDRQMATKEYLFQQKTIFAEFFEERLREINPEKKQTQVCVYKSNSILVPLENIKRHEPKSVTQAKNATNAKIREYNKCAEKLYLSQPDEERAKKVYSTLLEDKRQIQQDKNKAVASSTTPFMSVNKIYAIMQNALQMLKKRETEFRVKAQKIVKPQKTSQRERSRDGFERERH